LFDGCTVAAQGVVDDRQPKFMRGCTGNFHGLVEAAPRLARTVQWHRQERLDVDRMRSQRATAEQRTQYPCRGNVAAIFHSPDQPVQRVLVQVGGKGGIEVARFLQAPAAQKCVRLRQRQGAAGAGRQVTGQVCLAIPAQVERRLLACIQAEQAAGRKNPRQDKVIPSVNPGPCHRLTAFQSLPILPRRHATQPAPTARRRGAVFPA
jgi:hypothetical protein